MLVSSLPRPVGFVLGGGASLGAMQVGMLQALSEQAVFADVVIGTSVGALNGAAVALDPRGAANRLSHVWPEVTRDMVFPGGPVAQVRTLQRHHTHLFPSDRLAALVESYLGDRNHFDDLAVPFGAVTLDVASGAPRVIRNGPLLPALLASCAVPGIYPSVTIDHHQLYDGGVLANVPVIQALEMGARSLVVLDATFPGQIPAAPRNLAEAVLFTAMLSVRVQAQLEAPRAAEQVPVLYLPSPVIHRVSPLEFDHTAELIVGAYEAARALLDKVQVDGPGLYGPHWGR